MPKNNALRKEKFIGTSRPALRLVPMAESQPTSEPAVSPRLALIQARKCLEMAMEALQAEPIDDLEWYKKQIAQVTLQLMAL